jgi:CBS-domain-containing membrane protein
MSRNILSVEPMESAKRSLRQRLSLRGEIMLAIAPTHTVLSVLAFVEVLSWQRLLFASLASSAFLAYLEPHHSSTTARTLILSQLIAVTFGLLTNFVLGAGYISGAVAMVITIGCMIVLDVVHPPAVSTALSFAFQADIENNLVSLVLQWGQLLC